MVGGSKQLSWRSQESLVRVNRARAAANFALLENDYNEVELILQDTNYEIRALEILEEPERRTQASVYTLQAYEIVNDDRDEVLTGSRWMRQELPQ